MYISKKLISILIVIIIIIFPYLYHIIDKKNQIRSINYFKNQTKIFQIRQDKNALEQQIVFIGDSHIQGLAVNTIESNSINLGIGHEDINGMLDRIEQYSSLKTARAVIIMIGFNDLRRLSVEEVSKKFRDLIAHFKLSAPVYINELLPISESADSNNLNNKIRRYNKFLRELCVKNQSITCIMLHDKFINPKGFLASKYDSGDGIHLSKEGYSQWISILTEYR